jgi:hypothetical protein
VDHYVIFDDGSTDGSLEVLRRHPRVEVRQFPHVDQNSFVVSFQALENSAWKGAGPPFSVFELRGCPAPVAFSATGPGC